MWELAAPAPSLVKDYFRFVIAFFEVISTSAPHIYHSALLLSPQQSAVRKLYEQYARPLARVVHGLSFSWKPIVATLGHNENNLKVTWSPSSRFIAIAGVDSTSISIADAVTLKQLNTIELPQHHSAQLLSFSPDGRLLTKFGDGELTTWDLQTGGPVATFLYVNAVDFHGFSSTYSMDGKVIAVACERKDSSDFFGHTTTTIVTYNLLSKTSVYSYPIQKSHVIPQTWTHGDYIRFATVEPGSIRIWEIAFNSVNTPEEVDSLPLTDEIPSSNHLLFLPTPPRLALALQNKISVRNAQGSKVLLDFTVISPYPSMSFSPDGRFFAFSTGEQLRIWKESPTGYKPHQNLALDNSNGSPPPYFSPNGESVVMICDSSVRLWPTAYPIVPPYHIPDYPVDRERLLPVFSPDETLVAVRPEENRVMILDLESGDSRLAIDVDMKIVCVRVTGSMVVVASYEKAVAWDIPARDSALNSRVNMMLESRRVQ